MARQQHALVVNSPIPPLLLMMPCMQASPASGWQYSRQFRRRTLRGSARSASCVL